MTCEEKVIDLWDFCTFKVVPFDPKKGCVSVCVLPPKKLGWMNIESCVCVCVICFLRIVEKWKHQVVKPLGRLLLRRYFTSYSCWGMTFAPPEKLTSRPSKWWGLDNVSKRLQIWHHFGYLCQVGQLRKEVSTSILGIRNVWWNYMIHITYLYDMQLDPVVLKPSMLIRFFF